MAGIVVLLQHGVKSRDPVDPGLTDEGREQVVKAAEVLARAPLRALVSSPLIRAQESIRPLSAATGRPVIIDDRLRERMEYNPEVWLSVSDFLDDWQRTNQDRDHLPAAGDSSHAAAARLQGAVLDHVAPGGIIVMATHGGVTVDLLRSVVGDRQVDHRLLREGMPNGHLTTLVVTDGAIEIVGIGTAPHAWVAPGSR